MTNYVKSTNFTTKDTLPSGNALKIIKGSEFDTEFNAIATAVSTKADLASPTFTGTPLAPTASAGNNSTQIATTAYVDNAAATVPNYLDTTRINVASASTVDLTTNAPNTRHINITGTTTINGFTVAAGKTYFVRFNDVLTLTYGSAINTNTEGVRDIVTANGDTCIIRATAANTVEILSYVPVGTLSRQLHKIQAIVNFFGAQTLTLNLLGPARIDFRSSTLTDGGLNSYYVNTSKTITVPSGATLGTTSGVASKIALLAIDYAGTVEVAVVNTAGTVNLDETKLISTTAVDTAADSADVVYSVTARTNVPFRVIGYFESTQATAGAWVSTTRVSGTFQGMTTGSIPDASVTSSKLSGAQTGTAPVYGTRAWGRFDGTGSVGSQTITGSGNIASVSKTDTGKYTVTLTTAMPTTTYCVVGSAQLGSGPSAAAFSAYDMTTTSFKITTIRTDVDNPYYQDSGLVNFVVVG